ncbi:HlyD family type I secretion periplasmic adaptor subunit [Rhizobium sp. SL42]|uniref:HlyD family type I secretion periplasmic adaptor subunit n=1 Tax=Rhizobium sp. SL42 TaxID=2806346 RepID=UPI001F01BE2C|nr:HlyD family type I secretion periplasmic adaptor subunit [Rhizobium sp. SL42]UJW76045.1 HlyD family type I secretion periplasmic adaptor subunit [Rhizobium sp. SL42]
MNSTVPTKPRPARPVSRSRLETEFRPAALEILEQPASPIRAGLIWVICLFALSAIVWSYFGTFDIVATAQGKLQPQGRVKVIQSIEAGKTASIPVVNGARVHRGDLLVELDATDAKAELRAIDTKLSSLAAGITRRQAILEKIDGWIRGSVWDVRQPIDLSISFEGDLPEATVLRERFLYISQLEQQASTIASLKAQGEQQKVSLARLDEMIGVQTRLVATLQQKVAMREGLARVQAGSRVGLLDAVEAKQQEEATLVELRGQRLETQAALQTITAEADKSLASFAAEVRRELVEAMEQSEELQQQQVRARNRLKSLTITSPIDGTVQASALTTVGQVVASGTEVMRVVPTDAALEVEAYLPNRDIGFVTVGQSAVLKIEAFPFTRYGTVPGILTSVASDAIPEPDAQQLEGQPAKDLQSIIPVGNAQRTQNLVFPITVRPTVSTIDVDGASVSLSPGMTVSIEVKTGQRRILEYLFSPISEVTSEAMKER